MFSEICYIKFANYTTIQIYNRLLVIILAVIAQTLHDGTELRLGRVAIRKRLIGDLQMRIIAFSFQKCQSEYQ